MPELPTPEDVRSYPLRFDWVAAGYPIPAAGDPDTLQKVLEWASAYVASVTGQPIGHPEIPDYIAPWWDPTGDPTLIGPLVEQAIALRMAQVIAQSNPEYLETLADFDLIQSFTAGSYSETRRDPTRRGESKTVNDWPPLNELLWQIMTPDRWAYWEAYLGGKNVPGFEITEVDWSGMGYGDMESIAATRYELEAPWWPYG